MAAELESLKMFFESSQLDKPVVTATKTVQTETETPAIVTVIEADEIQMRGYSSIAEVLRAIPGFYDVYDLVTHNVGIRGINGGQNASGNILKLLIDGQPVDYRPTTGNYFGEELIPIAMVKRVEIVRGPASALYGAGAFLGVINIITKSGAEAAGVRLIGQAAMIRANPGGGGAMMVGSASGPVDVLIGGSYLYLDRSDLALPSTSPILRTPVNVPTGTSQNDVAQPASLFGRLSISGVLKGKLTLRASLQNLNSGAEFQSFTVLTHRARIANLNQNYWLTYEADYHPRIHLKLSGHYFRGAPTAQEDLDLGRSDYSLVRSVQSDGYGLSVEGQIKAHRLVTLVVGTDFVSETHLPQSFGQRVTSDIYLPDGEVLRKAGTLIPGETPSGTVRLRDMGVYAQGLLLGVRGFSAVAGLRFDYHDRFGPFFSPRAGLVYASPGKRVVAKLLYGASYKAPSAEQLFTQPIRVFNVVGNPSLEAQQAHTIELSSAFRLPKEWGEIFINGFVTDIIRRVEFLPTGTFFQAENIPFEWVAGAELDSYVRPHRSLRITLRVGFAKTVSRGMNVHLAAVPDVTNALYPIIQVHTMVDYALPFWGLKLSAEASYIGPRTASLESALATGQVSDRNGYAYTALSLSTAGRRIFGKRDTNLALRVSNVLARSWIEPGFGGVDIPSQGVTAMLTVLQEL